MINIKFPDGSVRTYEAGVTGYDVAMSISPRLAADVLAVSVKKPGEPETSKGTTIDLLRPINEDVEIRLLCSRASSSASAPPSRTVSTMTWT